MIIISIPKIVVSRNFLSITVVLSCFICSFSILKDSHLDSDVCSYGWHFMIASISFVRKLDHVPKNAKISAVRSLADICFLHVLIRLIRCIIVSGCASVFKWC